MLLSEVLEEPLLELSVELSVFVAPWPSRSDVVGGSVSFVALLFVLDVEAAGSVLEIESILVAVSELNDCPLEGSPV